MDLNGIEWSQQGQQGPTPPEQSSPPPEPRPWKRWIRPVFYVLYAIAVITGIPLVILDAIQRAKGEQSLVTTLAAVAFFAIAISIAISAWGIINHAMWYTRRALQKYIARIFLILPIFALTSWFSLRFPDKSIYLETVRQLYQAFLVYNYVFYLLAFFEEVPNFDNRLTMKPQVRAPRPVCFLKVTPSRGLIRKCKYLMLSYKILRIVLTIVSFTTYHTDTYEEGSFGAQNAYTWVTGLLIASQLMAMYIMSLLRKVTLEELQMLPKSTSQFVGIKLALFFDSFQAIFLSILASTGAIKNSYPGFVGKANEFAAMLQNFLLCFETVFLAALFVYAFDSRRYQTESHPGQTFAQSFRQFWTVSDITSRFRHRDNDSNGGINLQQASASSPTTQQNDAPPKQDPAAPRRRKTGHQFISMPDVILDHREDASDTAEIPSPRKQDVDDRNPDGSKACPTQKKEIRGIENPGYQGEVPEDSEPKEDKDDDDASVDTDGFLDEEFLTDDDDDSDNDLPIDGRLDVPRGAVPGGRRTKKVSYAGMTFDDLDPNKLGHPSLDSPAEKKKRVKKVSYAGMTFEDMDWEQIRSHRSPTMDSETARNVTSIVEQTEEQYTEGKRGKEKGNPDGEDFGSSEA